MVLGVDISTYLEAKGYGAKYYSDGQEVDPLILLRNNGVDVIRLRIWNNPYSEDGKPYLGGTNDIQHTLDLIKATKDYGFKYLIDFHYSDFWVDPNKQFLPKAWRNFTVEEVVEEVYKFTKDCLDKIKQLEVEVPYIQIGNEITNGLLWPLGQIVDEGANKLRSNYPNFINILNHGILGAREIYPDSKIVIHLEKSNDHYVYNELFSQLEKAHVDYDIIGMSYYPYWHGSFKELFDNINKCQEKFHKNVMICEVGYAFTLEDYILTENGTTALMVGVDNFKDKLIYPLTEEGQSQFIEHFLKLAKDADLEGVFYWEPLWIPGPGSCWASVEGQHYVHEEHKQRRNEWSNQCLFDYKGNKLPAFDKYHL